MKCPNCGNELTEGARFCVECGTPVTELAASVPEPEPVPAPETPLKEAAPAEPLREEPKPEAAPVMQTPVSQPVPVVVTAGTDPRMLLTSAQYFFLTILFHIPVIGLIFLFVWGLGRPKNISLKRFSLAMLLLRLIGWLLFLAGSVVMLLGLNGLLPNFSFAFQWPPVIG